MSVSAQTKLTWDPLRKYVNYKAGRLLELKLFTKQNVEIVFI